MGHRIKIKGTIYKVVGGSEVLVGPNTLIFYVPDNDISGNISFDNEDNSEEAFNHVPDFPRSGFAWGIQNSAAGAFGMNPFPALVSFGSGNGTYRFYLLNDDKQRMLEFIFSDDSSTFTNYSISIKFYINGSAVTNDITWGGMLVDNRTGYFQENECIATFPTPDNYKLIRYNIRYVRSTEPLSVGYGCNRNINSMSLSNKRGLDTWFNGYEPDVIDDGNPYDDLVDGNNNGGENTNFSEDSDTVSLDNLPTIDSIGTGFATLFTPNKTQLKSLASVFWNSNVFTALQNLVENITDMFTSLAMVPFVVDAGSTVEVTWLGLPLTSIYLTLASKQYYEFDMGSINLNNDNRIFKYDNALDYSPFSKLGIYLPFIGFQDLDIDECRNATLNLKYRIDILSGACVAIISVNGSILYQFSGNCLTQIPITNENMQSLVSDAVNVGIAVASARTAGAASSADIAAAENSDKMNDAQKEAHRRHAEVTRNNADNHLTSASANAVMGLKPQYNKTGSVSSAVSMLSVKQPYLFLTTSRLAIPRYYEHYAGFPSNITDKLNTFSGFTVVNDIRLNGLVATSQEVEEIYKLLKSGIII